MTFIDAAAQSRTFARARRDLVDGYRRPEPWSWADLSVIPALGLIVLNCIWVSLCFGILATRYRDIGPLLFSVVQLLFFMTPIIWNDETLRQQGAGRWSSIIELNPLLHY